MDASNQNVSCSTPGPWKESPDNTTIPIHYTPGSSLVPNRVFVRGLDYKTDESELLHAFSQHGAITDVKIVLDRFGMSKGYGFVTFQNEDDAVKVLQNCEGMTLRDRKLSVSQAFCKWKPRRHFHGHYPALPHPSHYISYPVDYQQSYHVWSDPNQPFSLVPVSYAALPLAFPQAYQPVYQHFTLYQYQWDQCQWNITEPPAAHPQLSDSPERMQEEATVDTVDSVNISTQTSLQSHACSDGPQ